MCTRSFRFIGTAILFYICLSLAAHLLSRPGWPSYMRTLILIHRSGHFVVFLLLPLLFVFVCHCLSLSACLCISASMSLSGCLCLSVCFGYFCFSDVNWLTHTVLSVNIYVWHLDFILWPLFHYIQIMLFHLATCPLK